VKESKPSSPRSRPTGPRPSRARPERGAPPANPRTDTGGLDEAMAALSLALDKKALEPVLLDVRALCSYCSYQLVLSGRSERQVEAIADGVAAGMKARGVRPIGSEGGRGATWQLIDFGDLLVHVFHHPVREHYDLEGLWSDAPRVPLEVPADARLTAEDQY
jgi:ribosome-associated protein